MRFKQFLVEREKKTARMTSFVDAVKQKLVKMGLKQPRVQLKNRMLKITMHEHCDDEAIRLLVQLVKALGAKPAHNLSISVTWGATQDANKTELWFDVDHREALKETSMDIDDDEPYDQSDRFKNKRAAYEDLKFLISRKFNSGDLRVTRSPAFDLGDGLCGELFVYLHSEPAEDEVQLIRQVIELLADQVGVTATFDDFYTEVGSTFFLLFNLSEPK